MRLFGPIGRNSGRILQLLLDRFFYARQWILNGLAYLSLRVYGIENATWQQVKAGRYDAYSHQDRDLSNAQDLDRLLSVAQDGLKTAEVRRLVVIDKCKTLLTLSSLLLAVATALLPKSFAFDRPWMRIVFFVAVLALFNSVILLLVFFDVRPATQLSLEQSRVDLPGAELKKSLINDCLRCQSDADDQTNYLVDLYKAMRFFFLFAFTIIAFLFSFSFFQSAPEDQSRAVARELQASRAFIDSVRGVKGDPGPPGAPGPKGDAGPKGDPGQNLSP